jgi:hypothetical protein
VWGGLRCTPPFIVKITTHSRHGSQSSGGAPVVLGLAGVCGGGGPGVLNPVSWRRQGRSLDEVHKLLVRTLCHALQDSSSIVMVGGLQRFNGAQPLLCPLMHNSCCQLTPLSNIASIA